MRIIFGLFFLVFANSNIVFAYPTSADLFQRNQLGYIGQLNNQNLCQETLGGYRRYNACKGQFFKADSDSPFYSTHTENGFNYSAGNPVLFSDPTGHAPQAVESIMQRYYGYSVEDIFAAGYRIGFEDGQRQAQSERTVPEDLPSPPTLPNEESVFF